MHYKVDGVLIRSENAAKPICQSSRHLREYLRAMPRVRTALDYGCGKLRYAVHLAKVADELVLVDSEVQLSRSQTIGPRRQSVIEYAKRHWPSAQVLTPIEFGHHRGRIEFALCSNVLSAIPSRRVRLAVVELIACHLKATGACLFTTQYRNSYFKGWANNPRAHRHGDGWVVADDGVGSFYALLDRPLLESHVRRGGMEVTRSWTHGESAYVLARPR